MGSESAGIDRRQFLARVGVLGAASVLPPLIPGRIAAALVEIPDPVLDAALSPVLQQVSRVTRSAAWWPSSCPVPTRTPPPRA